MHVMPFRIKNATSKRDLCHFFFAPLDVTNICQEAMQSYFCNRCPHHSIPHQRTRTFPVEKCYSYSRFNHSTVPIAHSMAWLHVQCVNIVRAEANNCTFHHTRHAASFLTSFRTEISFGSTGANLANCRQVDPATTANRNAPPPLLLAAA